MTNIDSHTDWKLLLRFFIYGIITTQKIWGRAASPSILGLNSYKDITFKPDW